MVKEKSYTNEESELQLDAVKKFVELFYEFQYVGVTSNQLSLINKYRDVLSYIYSICQSASILMKKDNKDDNDIIISMFSTNIEEILTVMNSIYFICGEQIVSDMLVQLHTIQKNTIQKNTFKNK